MEQDGNITQASFLQQLLDNPPGADNPASGHLQELIKQYPQSGLLQALYACIINRGALQKSALYLNSAALYKLAHHPSALPAVADEQIIVNKAFDNIVAAPAGYTGAIAVPEKTPEPEPENANADEEAAASNLTAGEVTAEPEDVASTELLMPVPLETTEEEHRHAEAVLENAETDPEADAVQTNTLQQEAVIMPEGAAGSQDDEIYEEIVGIEDIVFAQVSWPVMPAPEAMPEAIYVPAEVESAAAQASDDEAGNHMPADIVPAQLPAHEPVIEEQGIFDSGLPQPEVPVHTDKVQPAGDTIEESALPDVRAEDETNRTLPDAETAGHQSEFRPADHVDVLNLQEDTAPESFNHEPAAAVIEQEAKTLESIAPHAEDIVAEKLIIENIAATDYFIFDQAFRDRNRAEPVTDHNAHSLPVAKAAMEAGVQDDGIQENNDVSRYHDEKMPYSFMWWLDKTRREHAGIYQPYAKPEATVQQPAAAPAVNDKLQHQYIENIFHDNPVKGFEPAVAQTMEFDMRSKENQLIERFIQEEPHIKPPSSEKLGTENKAQKSAVDQDEIITETLVRIYVDQMLYTKAIGAYQKLMLKYPEKSSYFAGQITQLQKKIN